MTVSSIKSREQYNKLIEEGTFTELSKIEKQSKEYSYYKVEYINAALIKNTIIVAVW